MPQCDYIYPYHRDCAYTSEVTDASCILKEGHDGPHCFVNEKGQHVYWDYSPNCNCLYCMSEDSNDWCIDYSLDKFNLTGEENK